MNHVSHEESIALVEEIESHDAECTVSEERFVLSCRRILAEHGTLDDDELARLERIVRKLDARVRSDASEDDFEYEDDDDLYGDDEDDELEDDLDDDDELGDDEDDFDFDDFEDDDDAGRASFEDE